MAFEIVCDALGGQHHGDVYIAGQVGQPLGVSGVGKTGEVKGVLVSGGRDDGVYFSAERESDGGLDSVAGDAARADDTVTIPVGISASQCPHTHGYSALRWNVGYLVFGTDEGDVGIEGLDQRTAGNLGADAAGITQRHRQPRPAVRS
jgi:hypothetical protein